MTKPYQPLTVSRRRQHVAPWLAAIALSLAAGSAAAQSDCSSAIAAGALKSQPFGDGWVSFQPSGTMSATEAQAIDVLAYRTADGCTPVSLDRFEEEGGHPRLETVFEHEVAGQPNLFAIVSWPLDHVGLGTSGRYYAVRAYEAGASGITLNRRIVDHPVLASGVVGTVEGQAANFQGTSQNGLIALLEETPPLGAPAANSPAAACREDGNQMELNACAQARQTDAQAALEAELTALRQQYSDAPTVWAQLEAAQEHWKQQVDADIQALFPVGEGEDPRVLYGSSYPMQYASARGYLVQQRVDFLRAFWRPQDAR